MSAFLVNKIHVDYLIQAGLSRRLRPGHSGPLAWYHDGRRGQLDHTNADDIGRILWEANLASVAYRYPTDTDGRRPGPTGLSDAEIHGYTYTQRAGAHIDPVQVLSAVACLDYQSCEVPEWDTSEARAIITAIERAAIRALPGYDNARWELTDIPTGPVSIADYAGDRP